LQISVIIPVYNAAKYLVKAVQSALDQPEVAEVILVEDASPDNALEIARQLAEVDNRVKVFQHPDKKNHGAGASRNLGIEKSTCDYIAFLDADDYYLPERFKQAKPIFKSHPAVKGVYEAIGVHFYIKKNIDGYVRKKNEHLLTTIEKNIPPDKLFATFFYGKKGWWSLNGFTIKRNILDQTGLFDIDLRQAQDTDFILRACLTKQLYPGQLNAPVAMRGVHESNRTLDTVSKEKYKRLFYIKWFKKMLLNNWDKMLNRFILRIYITTHPLVSKLAPYSWWRVPLKIMIAIRLMIMHPRLITKIV